MDEDLLARMSEEVTLAEVHEVTEEILRLRGHHAGISPALLDPIILDIVSEVVAKRVNAIQEDIWTKKR